MKNEDARDLLIRSPIEEFKAFSRHKIELLEKFREVDNIKKYMDAFELGMAKLNAALTGAPAHMETAGGTAAEGRVSGPPPPTAALPPAGQEKGADEARPQEQAPPAVGGAAGTEGAAPPAGPAVEESGSAPRPDGPT